MAKRDKYFHKERLIRRLKAENDDVWTAIWAQGLIELDKPYHHGYNAEWVLRDDIARRSDADLYQRVLDMCGESVWSRNKDFKYKCRLTKKWKTYLPKLKPITPDQYEELPGKMQSFFYETTSINKHWLFGYQKVYACHLTYQFVISKSKSYVTHRREHNSVLYQRESEIESRLEKLTNGHPHGNYGYGRYWHKLDLKRADAVAKREMLDEVDEYYSGHFFDYDDYDYMSREYDYWDLLESEYEENGY